MTSPPGGTRDSFMEELSGALKNGYNYKIRLEELGRMARKTSRGDGKIKNAGMGAPDEEWRNEKPARLNPREWQG